MRGGGGEVVGRLLFLFQRRDQSRRWRLVGQSLHGPALLWSWVLFSLVIIPPASPHLQWPPVMDYPQQFFNNPPSLRYFHP